MKRLQQCLFIFLATITIAFGQKVAPGVNPQHYMDPAHNPHYQQVPQMQYVQPGQPMQHQQQQMHQPVQHIPQQQQPIHQQQQPIHQQQPPIHQQPMGHDPNTLHQQQHVQRPQQILDTANIQGEKAHIQEHFDVPMDTSKMSEQELQFHYFKMHDSDHNNKLDGCELIKSLIHWHEKSNKDAAAGHHKEEGGHHEKIFSDEELVALIDPILAMDDTGRDGYIDYPEFIKAQQKAASQNKVDKP